MSTTRFASTGGLFAMLALAGGCGAPPLDAREDLARVHEETLERTGLAPAGWQADDAPLGPPGSPAETPRGWDGGDRPLTLALALDTAFRRVPEIAAAKPRLAAARARFADAATPPNPALRWMVGVPVDPVEAVPFLISISTDLARLLERDAMEEAARHRLDAEILAVADVVVSKVFEIRLAHARARAESERVRVHLAIRDLAETRLAEVEHRVEVGEASEAARDAVAARLEAVSADLAEAEGTFRSAKLRLLRAIGAPERSLAFVLGPGAPAAADEVHALLGSTDGHDAGNEDARHDRRLVDIALRRRLDLLASDLEARARLVEIGLAERSVWRGLSLGVGLDRDMEGMRGVPFGGTVPLPIFDDGRIAKAAAAAAWRTALLDRVSLVHRIEFEVRSAASDLASRSRILARRSSRLADLAAVRDTAIEEYAAGFVSLERVRTTERNVLDAELAVIDARFETTAAVVALQRAMGGVSASIAPAELAGGATPAWRTEGRS